MRMIAFVFSLIAFSLSPHAALNAKPRNDASMPTKCRAMVGKEIPEGTGSDSHVGQLQAQRFSDCMMGMEH